MAVIYFRVDGNSDIATGHIMRCLAIARACVQAGRRKEQHTQISFLVSDSESRSLLEERLETPEEFAIYSFHSDYRNLEAEVPALLSYIACRADGHPTLCEDASQKKCWLFVDSYFATPAYFNLLSPYCRIAYLDDLRSFDCPVDLIINYDTDQDCPHYAGASHKLLGMQYTPLRTQFVSTDYRVRPEVSHILLSTGGTDPYGAAEHLLHIIFDSQNHTTPYALQHTNAPAAFFLSEPLDLGRLRSLHYHIVTSRANTRYDRLLSLASGNPHIHIHENVTDMASLMVSCDLAVSAGGTTLSELCAVGVPAVSYLMADNQRTAIENFAVRRIIPCAGDIRPLQTAGSKKTDAPKNLPSASVISNILHYMTYMSYNLEERQKSSHVMRAFLDGRGAGRIADTLLSF